MKPINIVSRNAVTQSGIEGILIKTNVPSAKIRLFDSVEQFISEQLKGEYTTILDNETYQNEMENTIKKILSVYPDHLIILVSDRLIIHQIRLMLQAGAVGYIYKGGDMMQSLKHAMSSVQRGSRYLSSDISELILSGDTAVQIGLSQQDMEILNLMAAQLKVKEIAYRLDISPRTIYRSRERLRDVLGVQTSETIVDAARQQGLLEDA